MARQKRALKKGNEQRHRATTGTMLPTIPQTDGVLVSDRDIRVSVTLNPMILAEDLADVAVGGKTASIAGFWEVSAGPLPRIWSSRLSEKSQEEGWVKSATDAGRTNQSRLEGRSL